MKKASFKLQLERLESRDATSILLSVLAPVISIEPPTSTASIVFIEPSPAQMRVNYAVLTNAPCTFSLPRTPVPWLVKQTVEIGGVWDETHLWGQWFACPQNGAANDASDRPLNIRS